MSNKQCKAAIAAAPPKPQPEEKMVRVANEDDDRRGPDGYINPRYAEFKGRWSGWSPAINVRLATMDEEYPHVPDYDWRGTAGFFHAILYPGTYGGRWRISCIGGDDYNIAKVFDNEKKARAAWEKINDHITIRTLKRLGFAPD